MKRQENPAAPMTAQALLDNLEDAGCGPEVTERFLALEQAGQYRELLRLLSDHRRHLLDCLHRRSGGSTAWTTWSISWRSAAPGNFEPRRHWRNCYDDHSKSDL